MSLNRRYELISAKLESAVKAYAATTSRDDTPQCNRRLLDNAVSLFLSWGCDVRIDSGSLEHVEGTALALAIGAEFDRIEKPLEDYLSEDHAETA